MTDKQLTNKAIKFKGSDYVMVKDRIQYLAENYDGRYDLLSDYQYFPEQKMWVVKATLRVWDTEHKTYSEYNGLAQEIEDTTFINKTSALENAESSAWWRACAAYNIWVISSIASMDEINKAENRAKSQTKSFTKESVFQRAYNNTEFIKQCLSEDDFIKKVSEHMELDEIQEGQLRRRYQELRSEEKPDLPFWED